MLSSEFLVCVLEQLPHGVVAYDAEERLVYMNKAYVQERPEQAHIFQLGRTYEDILTLGEALGQRTINIGEHRPTIPDRMELFCLPSGHGHTRRINGKIIRLDEIKLPDGGTVVVRSDITARIKAETSLLELENRFATIFEETKFGIMIHEGTSNNAQLSSSRGSEHCPASGVGCSLAFERST